MKRNILKLSTLIMILTLAMLVSACGDKPSSTEPSQDQNNSQNVEQTKADSNEKDTQTELGKNTQDETTVAVDETVVDDSKQDEPKNDQNTQNKKDTKDTKDTKTETTKKQKSAKTETVDVDLTKLSSTMVYSEVYNMMEKPEDYEGKSVKVKGNCSVYTDEETGKTYYACIIQDATACCSQGLEFALKSGKYPKEDDEITLKGTFSTYEEDGYMYIELKDAELL